MVVHSILKMMWPGRQSIPSLESLIDFQNIFEWGDRPEIHEIRCDRISTGIRRCAIASLRGLAAVRSPLVLLGALIVKGKGCDRSSEVWGDRILDQVIKAIKFNALFSFICIKPPFMSVR